MLYAWILVSLFTFSVQAMEQQKAIILSAVHEVLFKPSTEDLPLPTCLSAKNLEKELIEATRKNDAYQNPEAAKHPGKVLSLPIKAWLLDLETNENMKQIARAQISRWTQPLLYYTVTEAAFSPAKSTSYLKPIKEVIALMQACKNAEHRIAIATNWNSEGFTELQKKHSSVLNLFEEHYISANLKKLTMDPAFFASIKEQIGKNTPYFYIDIAEGQESLDAAQQAGITPIVVPDLSDKEKAIAIKSQLVKYGLFSE